MGVGAEAEFAEDMWGGGGGGTERREERGRTQDALGCARHLLELG